MRGESAGSGGRGGFLREESGGGIEKNGAGFGEMWKGRGWVSFVNGVGNLPNDIGRRRIVSRWCYDVDGGGKIRLGLCCIVYHREGVHDEVPIHIFLTTAATTTTTTTKPQT